MELRSPRADGGPRWPRFDEAQHGRCAHARWGEACAVTSGAIALVSLIGHVYGVPALTRLTSYATQMAVHTSAMLLLLSLGVLAAFPDGRLKGLLASSGPGGMVARRLVPTV